ncbi:hypothetical protein [Stenotrophomonas indicatrix]|uniref:hypothetical protein n=1 Tax=Stenotrophomonas indicatrix TaxID=2045451 RepID=UPI001482F67F|nr:hypothetical protein [Stenotrophomonas indicatrix]
MIGTDSRWLGERTHIGTLPKLWHWIGMRTPVHRLQVLFDSLSGPARAALRKILA